MEIKEAFACALKQARKAQGLTQEDFSDVSSRTYISTLERGLKSPTVEKVDALSQAMKIHPLTLMMLTYMMDREESTPAAIIEIVRKEINQILG